ncbi:MAG: hypothetical protein E7385_01375 [Ruminococcaceae bacterium]|nr:hypothetical protein [Oscillospiraceae bacterium]
MAKPENTQQNKKPFFSEKTRRRFRFGSGSLFMLIAAVVLFAVINIVLEQLPMSIDISKDKMYTLSEASIEKVKSLDQKIEIIALYDRVRGEADSQKATIIRILDQYERYGGDMIDISYVSLDDNPGIIADKVPNENLASAFGENDYIVRNTETGRVQRIDANEMFSMELDYTSFQYNIISVDTEKVVTSSLYYVTAEHIPVIYFSTSYGEEDLDDFTSLTDNLSYYNYDVKTVDLDNVEAVPEDASIIVFMSPERDLTDRLYNMMYDWLTSKDGGDAIFAFDPILTGGKLTNFNKLLSELYGIQVNSDVVTDVTGNQLASAGKENYIYASSVQEKEGPLADFAPQNNFYAFNSSSIKILASVGDYDTGALITTRSEDATCTDISTGTKITGKATLAAYGQRSYTGNKVVVFGSSELLKDDVIKQYKNTNTAGAFIYSISWMEDMYASAADEIEVKTGDGSIVAVTQSTSRGLAAFAIIIYPILIILVGVIVWLIRRHL